MLSTEPSARERFEQEVRALWHDGDHRRAAEVMLRTLGPEIYTFLGALHRDDDECDEIFSLFSERVWRGLPTFEWGASLRTWAYVIARGCSLKYRRDAGRRRQRYPRLETDAALAAVAAQVRTETRPYLRSDVKSKMAALREQLTEEDREILLLRIDRGLEWRDLARVLHEDEEPSGERLTREAQRLRKRFQLLKERLRQLGQQAGLLK
ncbi:MAG: sigma-70 family RNA polymerase sigma factor [Myxococcaceae bacterium]|nr:sigma-70 family RNA polymerase sigma factor [Myxococcaceae bacterium]